MIPFLAVLSGVTALAYGVFFCWRNASISGSVFKTASIVALAMIAVAIEAPILLISALMLSSLGDLALSREGENAFLVGLSSFAMAHVAYILLFAGLGSGWPPLVPALVLFAFALSTELWLAPFAGKLRWPVRVYVLLIAGMGTVALTLPGALVWVLIGAGAFLLSDTLLAIQLFRLSADSPWNRVIARLLWALYYAAQVLILWGIAG